MNWLACQSGHVSGERVSNVWVIYLSDRDNLAKARLIPSIVNVGHPVFIKDGDLSGPVAER